MISVSIHSEFMRLILLRRYELGAYVDGKWVDGVSADSPLTASVQPMSAAEYKRLPEGFSGLIGYKVWSNVDFQLGTDAGLKPDELLIDGLWFKLINKDPWIENGYSSSSFVEAKP